MFAGLASAASISTSKHDLSSTGPGPQGSDNEICKYCHTPHGGSSTAPLWNKNLNAGYTQYSSPTLNMTISAQPGPVSLACLSCHDGTTSIGAMINGGTATITGVGNCTYTAGVMGGTCAELVTKVLSNDHPVGITYDNTLDTAFNSLASVKTAGM